MANYSNYFFKHLQIREIRKHFQIITKVAFYINLLLKNNCKINFKHYKLKTSFYLDVVYFCFKHLTSIANISTFHICKTLKNIQIHHFLHHWIIKPF